MWTKYQSPQAYQAPSSPTPYQPKTKDKNPSQNNDDNKDIISLINEYFQQNQASSVELSENKNSLITYKENGWVQCKPVAGSRLQKIKNYLEKSNKNSISKEELASLSKNRQTIINNSSVFYYLTWIFGILVIIILGLAIRFSVIKMKKNKK